MTQIDSSKQCWDLMDRPETDETYETFGPCGVSGALHWHQRLWQHCTATRFWWRWGRWYHHQIAAGLCYPPRLCYTIPKGCPTGNPYLSKNLISTFIDPTSSLNFDFLEWTKVTLPLGFNDAFATLLSNQFWRLVRCKMLGWHQELHKFLQNREGLIAVIQIHQQWTVKLD